MLFGIVDRQPLFHTGAYLDVAYVFGNMGNLAEGPGAGWSVEDEFAWTIGAESELTLPLPGHDKGCFLRFNVHAAVFFAPPPPAEVNEQSGIPNTQKWDSLRQIMLMSELETHYGLELSD